MPTQTGADFPKGLYPPYNLRYMTSVCAQIESMTRTYTNRYSFSGIYRISYSSFRSYFPRIFSGDEIGR